MTKSTPSVAIECRRLLLPDLDSLFALRLMSLEHSSSAFRMSLEEEVAHGPSHFTNALTESNLESVIFGALDGLRVVAMAGIIREPRLKIKHRATIWGMYVHPDYRGQSLARRLMELAIEHGRSVLGVQKLNLTLESENKNAKALYESLGFRAWGREPKAMFEKGRFFDEENMTLLF